MFQLVHAGGKPKVDFTMLPPCILKRVFYCRGNVRGLLSLARTMNHIIQKDALYAVQQKPANFNPMEYPQKNYTTLHALNGQTKKTIYSLSSGHGRAGIAVIRVSGAQCQSVLKHLIRRSDIPEARVGTMCSILSPTSGELLDKAIVLWFPGPRSFTGEDVCEFHVHGGPAVIRGVLSALGSCEGLRSAEPGEFTKRAFLNGKLDLTGVEGLGDLVDADTEVQRRQALRQMSGDLAGVYQDWRERLLEIVAHVEAFIDFSEDESIEGDILEHASNSLEALSESVRHHLADNRRGERLRSGVHVTIVGEPNAGKSSLLNLICKRPAAIVTPIAGTTRDVIESAIDLGGYPVVLSDTAGIRDSQDVVEKEGVRRATERAENSDMVLLMTDVSSALLSGAHSRGFHWEDFISTRIAALTQAIKEEWKLNHEQSSCDDTPKYLVLLNKVDLLPEEERNSLLEAVRILKEEELGLSWCYLSCKTTEGLDHFLEVLRDKVAEMCGDPLAGNPSLTQLRHRTLLTLCLEAMSKVNFEEDLVICAEHLRESLRQLGKVTGHVGVEEILDVIFKDFCIGK